MVLTESDQSWGLCGFTELWKKKSSMQNQGCLVDICSRTQEVCTQAMGCIFYSLFAYVGRFSGIILCTEYIHNTIHNNAN